MLPGQHLRLPDRQLETLAPHQLDEHRELQLAPPLHLPRIGAGRREDAQGHVADQLLVEPALDLARRQPVAFGAGQHARVDADRHRQAGLVHGRDREGARVVRVGDRLADRHLGQPGEGDDLPRPGLERRDAVERLRHV